MYNTFVSHLVISDLHLDRSFDAPRFRRLRELIDQHDHVIICGDLWEGYSITFDEFLQSQWNTLFPLLKERDTVYIYGNHDRKVKSDDRIYTFCTQATTLYKTTIGQTHFIFEHGDRLSPKIDAVLHIDKPHPIYFALSELVQLACVKLLGVRGFWILYAGQNEKIKKASAQEYSHLGNYMYVCGHTDCAEVDVPRHFANSGFSKYGYIQYLVIDDAGSVTLHMERS